MSLLLVSFVEFLFAGLAHSLDYFLFAINFSIDIVGLVFVLFVKKQHCINFDFIFDDMLQTLIAIVFVFSIFVSIRQIGIIGKFLFFGHLSLIDLVLPISIVVGTGLGSLAVAGFIEFVHWLGPF